MLAVQGYYDGNTIRIPDGLRIRKNQKLIITVLDEFAEQEAEKPTGVSLKGSLARYADPARRDLENTAWEFSVSDSYDPA